MPWVDPKKELSLQSAGIPASSQNPLSFPWLPVLVLVLVLVRQFARFLGCMIASRQEFCRSIQSSYTVQRCAKG